MPSRWQLGLMYAAWKTAGEITSVEYSSPCVTMLPMLKGKRHQLETALEKTREQLRRSRQREEAKDRRIERLRAELDKRRQYPKIEPTYHADSLCVWRKNTEFLREPRFVESYAKAMDSWHKIDPERGSKIHVEWRIHILCWAAYHALKLPGDFVECGVRTGMSSLAVAHYVDFNATGKSFYLFDTFSGIPEEQINAREQALGVADQMNERYGEGYYEIAKENFSPYPKAYLVRGRIPDTLDSVEIERVSYLSIDMNIVAPEIAAIRHFWPKLSPGAPVILDDYGWLNHAPQKEAMDEFAESVGCKILTLPTGQGLLLKP